MEYEKLLPTGAFAVITLGCNGLFPLNGQTCYEDPQKEGHDRGWQNDELERCFNRFGRRRLGLR